MLDRASTIEPPVGHEYTSMISLNVLVPPVVFWIRVQTVPQYADRRSSTKPVAPPSENELLTHVRTLCVPSPHGVVAGSVLS